MKKVILTFISAVFLCLSITVTASAAPLAECYGYNSGGGIDTTDDIAYVNWRLGTIGYDSRAYNNCSAYYTRRTMGDDAVFVGFSHGAPGRLVCYDTSGYSTYLSANSTTDDSAYSLENRFNNTGELRDLKFAAFFGCETGATDPTYGNLLSKCTEYGVDCVVGFSTSVNKPCADLFVHNFMYYMSTGHTVYRARERAMDDVAVAYGWYGGVESLVISGENPWPVSLTDCRYGVY